ncbi:MAG: hypothetical protein R3C18_16015 [Planctomycetaceae bacterium]
MLMQFLTLRMQRTWGKFFDSPQNVLAHGTLLLFEMASYLKQVSLR